MEELKAFRHRIEKHFARLTNSEQKIAAYLLANFDQAAFLTASQLARHLEISEATVVRFARSIGYRSFPEFKRVVQDIYRFKATPATRLQHKLADLQSGKGHVLHQIIEMELQYLAEVPHSIATQDFDRAVKLLLKSKRIFVFGTGPSRILADLMELRLRRFGLTIFGLTESGRDVLDKLLLLRRDDAVIAAGFHRVTGELLAVLNHARRVGAPAILLTDTLNAQFKKRASVVLSARRGPVSTFHSLTVPMAIINAIILAVALECPATSVASLDLLQSLRAESGLDFSGK